MAADECEPDSATPGGGVAGVRSTKGVGAVADANIVPKAATLEQLWLGSLVEALAGLGGLPSMVTSARAALDVAGGA